MTHDMYLPHYTCPCSCNQSYTEDKLTDHLMQLTERSVSRHLSAYRRAGGEMPSAAVREVWDTYGDFLHEALSGNVPDWRNSDGLRGYADRTVRTVPVYGPESHAETLEHAG